MNRKLKSNQLAETVLMIGMRRTRNEIDASTALDQIMDLCRQSLGQSPPGLVDNIQEALEIARRLGLKQSSRLAALSLMALVQLAPGQAWSTAARRSLRLHDISSEIERLYRVSYAENTRESIRRDVIAPLLALGVLERNPDNPGLPGNSPHTHYAVRLAALDAIQAYGTEHWQLELCLPALIPDQEQLPGIR